MINFVLPILLAVCKNYKVEVLSELLLYVDAV